MFCENCGLKIKEGANVCGYCGHKFTPIVRERERGNGGPSGLKDAGKKAWLAFSQEACEKGYELGMILVNTTELSDATALKSALDRYIEAKKAQGVRYAYLDLKNVFSEATVSCENVLRLLKQLYAEALPRYLLLIGDNTVIGSERWQNEYRDSDKFVDSDLPYVTMDRTSPWRGIKFDFSDVVRVGRIPATPKDGFKDAIVYLENTAKATPYEKSEANVFSVSAEPWKVTSMAISEHIGNKNLYVSPEFNLDNYQYGLPALCNRKEPNLLYFNLHGSPQTNFWSGQRGFDYPSAFSPDCLSKNLKGYAIGVEACYGAKPFGGKDSVLMRALNNGCIAFLGSTKIALGAVGGGSYCADTIVDGYLKALKAGKTAGDAYVDGLVALNKDLFDEGVAKTFAEFFLYGDPSVRLFSSTSDKGGSKSNATRRAIPLRKKEFYAIATPDQARIIHFSDVTVTSETKRKIDQFASRLDPNMVGSLVKVYSNGKDIVAVYEKNVGGILSSMRLYFDERGNFSRSYLSK